MSNKPVQQSHLAETNASHHEKLRSWYLARLRKRAFEATEIRNLTPAALIAADRKYVEQLILADGTKDSVPGDAASLECIPKHLRRTIVAGVLSIAVIQLLSLALLVGTDLFTRPDALHLTILKTGAGVLGLMQLALLTWFGWYLATNLSRDIRSLKQAQDFVLRGKSVPRTKFHFAEVAQTHDGLLQISQRVQELSERERVIADHASEVICSIEPRGRFIAISPACIRLLGYAPHELVGSSLWSVILPECVESARNSMIAAQVPNAELTFESRLQRKDGSIIDLAFRGEWSNTEQSFFSVIEDITAQRQVERIRQEFLAMLSHDLRSPLSAVFATLNCIGLGVWGELASDGKLRIANAERTIQYVMTLINDLLDIHKMEARQFPIELQAANVADIFRRSIETVMPLAERNSIVIRTNIDCFEAMLDSELLVRMVTNLLSNALKVSPQSGFIDVSAHKKPGYVEGRITDQGPGIPLHLQAKIFDRFYQIGSNQTKVGTGLGLAICQNIVNLHHGQIGVVSEPGSGSTFWFRIPDINRQ